MNLRSRVDRLSRRVGPPPAPDPSPALLRSLQRGLQVVYGVPAGPPCGPCTWEELLAPIRRVYSEGARS